ncbi:MAG: ABC transporter permease, partial [Pseudolabrys sp.]
MTRPVSSHRIAARIAAREMRGGLKGFRVFLACLLLGVASIAAVGSLASAILEGIRQNGQELLGGDVEVQSQHGDLSAAAVKYLETQGTVTRVVEMRAMGKSVENDSRTLIQLKAVDGAY